VAEFSADPTSGERPLEVSFTDLSTGEVTGWEWDFGDTVGTSQEQHPTYTYQDAGDYTVTLTVTGPGGSDGETKVNYIDVAELPSLVVDHAIGAPGSYFVFTGQHFAPNTAATISVNGTVLVPTVPTDGTGGLEFALRTLPTMSTGGYFVTASTGSSATAFFQLVTGADQWPDPGTDPTIELPLTIAPAGSIYLPLVMRYYAPPVPDDPIVNGDFESGPEVGWDENSLHFLPIVMDSGFHITPHSGTWLAWLGGYSYEIAWIEQPVTIPVGRSYLHYWHWRESSESDCNQDQASLRVDGDLIVTYDLCVSTNTGQWVEGVVDLSAYAGQTVPLQFRAETLLSASSWYLDDISFEASAAILDAAAPSVPDPGLQPARKIKSAPDSPLP
jgi:PKD repeat protein